MSAYVEILDSGIKRWVAIVELLGPVPLSDDSDNNGDGKVDVTAAKIALDHLQFFVANLWYAVVYVLTLTNRIARIRQRCSKKNC